MRLPAECYRIHELLGTYLPSLRPAQHRGLARWVSGTLLAQSAGQNALISALAGVGPWHTVRQALREWLYDGADKAAPCAPQVAGAPCFVALLRWVLTWWQGQTLALAVDATAHQDRLVAFAVSVL